MSALASIAGVFIMVAVSLIGCMWSRSRGASRREQLLFAILIATQILTILSVIDQACYSRTHMEYVVGAGVLALLCLVASLLLVREVGAMMRVEREASRAHILSEQMAAQMRYAEQLEQERRAGSEERERFVSYVARLRDALDGHDVTEMRSLLDGISQVCSGREGHVCAHPALDALLLSKRVEARRARVSLELHVEVPDSLSMDSVEVCAIFGNLIDNAIAACGHLEPATRWVSVGAHVAHGYVACCVQNPFSTEADARVADGSIVPHHGRGLFIVRELVERHDGALHVERIEGEPSVYRVDAFWRA